MSELMQWATTSPYLFFFMACFFGLLALTLVEVLFFRLPNRFIRAFNIRKHGWPPAHCDADGDSVEMHNTMFGKKRVAHPDDRAPKA